METFLIVIGVVIVVTAIDAYMNHLAFRKPWNSGYLSVTYPVEHLIGEDAWHDLKKILIALLLGLISYLAYGWTFKGLLLFIAGAFVHWLVHEGMLHYVLKEKNNAD
jgi:uncharacterized membrane protein YesL